MLRSLKDLERYDVSATDGKIGTVRDFLLDDEYWLVRDLVVETGGVFMNGGRVLISPISFRQVDWETHCFHLALTMAKVKGSPGIDTDKPVSRQHERDYYQYYAYPYYWGGPGIWGMGDLPGGLANVGWQDTAGIPAKDTGDVHLRSAREVQGYHVQGSDDGIGHIDDFIVDDQSWRIRYLVVDTSNWWMGKKVLIAPHWASRVSWDEKLVFVDMPRKGIKDSPEWVPTAAINRAYETRLYDFYGRPTYWAAGEPPAAPKSNSPEMSVGH